MKQALQITFGIAILAASLQSCDKVKSAIKTPDVTFTGASADIIIPATSDTTASGTIGSGSVKYNIDSMIKAQTGGVVTYKSISSVKITKVYLTLNDADANNNFGNFQVAGASFNTDAKNGALQPYDVAYIENNPATFANTLDLPLLSKDTNLKDYFASNSTVNFAYILTGKLRHATKKDLHCHVEVTYDIAF